MNLLRLNTARLSALVVAVGASLVAPAAMAATPSLSDGFLCFAGKKGGYYFYTSSINDASISQKQPVRITILQKQGGTGVTDVIIYDRTRNTVTIADLEQVRGYTPEATPVGSGTVTFTGNNTFTGKTTTGAPLSLKLAPNYTSMTLMHNGKTYNGICR